MEDLIERKDLSEDSTTISSLNFILEYTQNPLCYSSCYSW
jgi:hypothetical protein